MTTVNVKELFDLTKNLDVLYVEDDIDFNAQTKEILEDFFALVDTSFNGLEGLHLYNQYFEKNGKHYDIVISDLNMPKMDGITLTKEIYSINKNQPVIIISAYNESSYLVELINIGVEKFLQKPFRHEQLLDVLFNTLHKKIKDSSILKLTPYLIWNKQDEILIHQDEIVKLTKKELELLKLLIKNRSKISTFQEIFNVAWSDEYSIATKDSLKMHISRLRKKLVGIDLEVVYNIGYRLNF
jgi:DNA-binding response OmpR family regulator